MALYPFVHVPALELHALSRYPGNRQNDRQTEHQHQQTTVCLHYACAPRHNDRETLEQILRLAFKLPLSVVKLTDTS